MICCHHKPPTPYFHFLLDRDHTLIAQARRWEGKPGFWMAIQWKSSKRYKESLVKQLQRERDQAALRAQKPGSTEQRTPVQTVRPGAQEKPLPNTFPNLISCFSEQACYEIKLYFMFWPPRFPPVGWEGGALDTCME